ncbi:hypothetical protein LPJ59_003106, partial [Coemansia sp. RSA 2399]
MKFTITLLAALASPFVLALEATPSSDATVSLMPTAIAYKPIEQVIKRDAPAPTNIDLDGMANIS